MLKANVNVVIHEMRRPYRIFHDFDDATKRPLLPHPSAGHFPQQVAPTFVLAS